MDAAIETAIAQFVELIKCTAGPITSRIKHFKELDHNMELLKQKIEELNAKESDIKTQLQTAGVKRKRPLEEPKVWLKKVKITKDKVNEIETSLAQETHNYFSKFYSRSKLAELVVEKIQEVDQLQATVFPGGLVCDAPADETPISFDPPSLHGQSTAEQTMGEIMELLLNNPEIGKIGVYGMGGVGKTTIMKNINDKLAEMMKNHQQHFNRIIWVTVSKEVGGIREIQHKIALEVSKEFSDELSRWDDEGRRAAALLRELKGIGKFLIILDDLWKEITLQEVGIPQPNKENNCKVLVTTRNLKVCDSIETQKNVEVKCLSHKEAWELFVSKVGDHILADNDPEIEDVAKQVVRECGGLPLAIITIGCAMRRRQDIGAWRLALKELQSSTIAESSTDLGMKDKVFKFLRFSYDNLKSQVFQKCFLYCAFFPEDYKIPAKDLIMYWIAEGYIEEEGNDDQYDKWATEAEMNKGFEILEELKDACMLESCILVVDDEDKDGYKEEKAVTMHDLVRDLAINIMKKDFGFLAKAGMQLKELPKEAWERANKISLIRNNVVNFPKQLNCPSLSTLLLQENGCPFPFGQKMVFPSCFFSRMPALCVLDLSHCFCEKLPSSLSNLASLRYLNLSAMEIIKELPQGLEALWNLRYLNLFCSGIEELPQGLGALKNLRYLNLSGSNIKELPQGLGALSNLRYLNLRCPRMEKLPQGLGALLNLRYLNLSSSKIKELPQGLGALLNLRYLNLSSSKIKELPQGLGALKNLNYLNLSHLKIKELPQGLGALMNLRYLNLSFTKIEELPQEMEALVHLKFLDLIGSPSLKIHGNVLSKFTLLEKLRLPHYSSNSPTAATIIKEMTYLKCLRSLSMGIEDYGDYLDVIKYVPWDSVKRFFIEVGMDCQVFNISNSACVVSLNNLDMCDKMSSFCIPNNTKNLQLKNCKIPPLSEFRCLENVRSLKMRILTCKLVSGNFLVGGEEMEQNALASLNVLYLYDMDGLKAFGEGKLPNGCLANLKDLSVGNCNSFKSLFSLEILQHLNNIEAITVAYCDEIEEIVSHGDGDNLENVGGVTTTNNIIILPKLWRLSLRNLPKLRSIGRKTTWVCDSLAELEVFKCPKIEDRLPFKSLPSIKRIRAEREWWEGLQWDDAETKALLQPYFIDKGSAPEEERWHLRYYM